MTFPAASSRPAAAAETIPTPEDVAAEIFSEVTIGAHLDPRMTRREVANWGAEGIAVIAAALRAERERGATEMRERLAEAVDGLATDTERRYRRPVTRLDMAISDYEALTQIRSYKAVAAAIRQFPLTPPAQDGGSETQP